MFGVFLGLESFSKEMRVGAYVVVLAAILLPVVGPGVQENQDILALLKTTGAIAWSTILLASLAISSAGLAVSNIRRKRDVASTAQDYNMFVFNLVAQTSGAVVGTTVAKMFVLVQGAALGVCVALWLVSSVILVYATVLQATTVSQGKFVPLSVGTKIAVNAITGIIVWEDWRVVTSWIGYVCVFLYLMLGNYLLCDVDLFGTQNSQYGTAATLEKMKSAVFDPKLTKAESDVVDEENIEMQGLREAPAPSVVTPTNASTTPIPDTVKSASTSEAADWISERDTGSEGVLSSSTAEADDFMSDREAEKARTTTDASDRDLTKMEQATTESTAYTATESTHDPTTVSGVWRKAYHVDKKSETSTDEPTSVDSDPQTASGVWRKAYQVKK